jgi:alkanesulfonate monooxygenase SsuD/methylene tetrahydromethanopterin reductase-like flavin-dependent oxidoreductase (luciferase family)
VILSKNDGSQAMRFGVTQQTQPQAGQPYHAALRKVVDVCLCAEELGFHTFSMAEQHFTPYILNPDSLQFFTYLAAKTSRLRFASGIIVVPLHHPIQFAERVALLDVLSDGRFELGIGRGHHPRAFEGMNVPIDEAGDRFDEYLAIAKLAWGPEPFTFEGRYYRTPDPISVNPKPVQQPHPPIWVAAVSEYSLEKLARADHGLLVPFNETFEVCRDRVATYRRLRRDEGLPEAGGRARMNPLTLVLESQREAEEVAESYLRRWTVLYAAANPRQPVGASYAYYQTEQYQRDRQLNRDFNFADHASHAIFGDPRFAVERIRYLRDEVGATEMNFCVGFGGVPFEIIQRSLRLLVDEVLPRV